MSESFYFQRQTNRFLASHPREAGWVVQQLSSDAAEKLSLQYLVDCLREWHPTACTYRNTMPWVGANDFKPLDNVDERAIGTAAGTTGEPRSYGWRGTIEWRWNGHAIHAQLLSLCIGDGNVPLYFIATTSLAAFRDFLLVLARYGKTRHKERKEIYVANGDNIPVAPRSWDDLVLPEEMLRDIRANVDGFFAGKERYAQLGIPHRRGFLFAGPPGCGKTLTLKTLAANTAAKCVSVMGKADVEDDVLRFATAWAERHAPAVLLLEDLDRIVQAEGVSMSYLLNLLDGLKEVNGVLVIATCNEPDMLDPALIHRPSRFDRVWRFELPHYTQRLELLRKRGANFFSEAALETVARRSEGFSMAYVQEIVVSALLECTSDDRAPSDARLLKSLDTIKRQSKCASTPVAAMDGRETVGFSASSNGGA